MERVIERKKDLEKALKQFHNSIGLLNNVKNQKNASIEQMVAYRDSVIKRFELCYDLLWKCLKDSIERKFGILVSSPKKVFQESRVQNLIGADQLAQALAMADDRNLSAHTYDEELSEEIAQRAISHYELMQKLYVLIKI
jgi:nucleotidyltransferase substrate binding protein (TIGR01987 family)